MHLFTENDMINSAVSVSKLDEIPCPSPNFLSINYFPDSPQMHFEYEHIYLQFLETFHQHQSIITDTATIITTTASDPDSNIVNMLDQEYSKTTEENVREEDDVVVIRKTARCGNSTTATTNTTTRRSKKDRHSKINTARGPRDRRMRLSLEVARKFFDLQDLLGFDKPSKTVDWLLENSRDAIRELASDGNYSCCEVVSSITTTSDQEFACSNNYSSPPPFAKGLSEVEKRNSSSSSSGKNNVVKRVIGRKKKENKKKSLITVERESRRRARERARERTSQKRRLNEIITTIDDRDQQIRRCIADELSSASDQKVYTYDTDYNELVRLKDILAPTSNYCSSIFGKHKDRVN